MIDESVTNPTIARTRHILPLARFSRKRLLPIAGRVQVRKGQTVGAMDIIAETNLAPRHMLLNISRGLGMPPIQAEKYLQVDEGTEVFAGDLLAGPVGLTRRVVRSPSRGKVIQITAGQLLLEVFTTPFYLRAGYPGVVSEVINRRGAVVESNGFLVQGTWGNGQVNAGTLVNLIKHPNESFRFETLSVVHKDQILLAGHCASSQILLAAAELPVRGLVLSSLEPELVSQARALPIPLMVLEGFGQRPLNPRALELFTSFDHSEAALNAEAWDLHRGLYPELTITAPPEAVGANIQEEVKLEIGQRVRVTGVSYFGKIGEVIDVYNSSSLPNGIYTPACQVELESGERLVLPAANLEGLVYGKEAQDGG